MISLNVMSFEDRLDNALEEQAPCLYTDVDTDMIFENHFDDMKDGLIEALNSLLCIDFLSILLYNEMKRALGYVPIQQLYK